MASTATSTIEAKSKRRGPPKGSTKVPGSGRKRGTLNKRTAEVRDLLLSLKCDPITGMARIAMNRKNPPDLRGRMYAELAQYMHSKRRAVELTGRDGGPLLLDFLRGLPG